MTSKNIRIMVTASMFVALDIIVGRFLALEIPSPMGPLKFDFQIVVAMLCGYALGPLWGTLALTASDILGALLNGGSMGFFFGFTITAVVRAMICGILLYKKPIKPIRIIITVFFVVFFCDLGLNTLWISILSAAKYLPLLISRAVPKLMLFAAESAVGLLLLPLFNIIKVKIIGKE